MNAAAPFFGENLSRTLTAIVDAKVRGFVPGPGAGLEARGREWWIYELARGAAITPSLVRRVLEPASDGGYVPSRQALVAFSRVLGVPLSTLTDAASMDGVGYSHYPGAAGLAP